MARRRPPQRRRRRRDEEEKAAPGRPGAPGRPFRGPKAGSPVAARGETRPPSAPVSPAAQKELAEAIVATRKLLRAWLDDSKKLQDTRSAPQPSDALQLDPWQDTAVTALQEGANVIVDAPTTAGKTRVVETFFRQNMHRPEFRACYTTPVKSLSNDKLKEFREMFGAENVGIATGDIKENLGAPIVVATLESYRNSLLGVEPDLGRTLVVFDEYHYLQDHSRGSAWEEAIILTPDSCQILMLSASASNADEFAGWLERISRRPCRLVSTLHRPVPLEDLVFYREHWLTKDSFPMPRLAKTDPGLKFPLEQPELARRIKDLPSLGLTPCILYCGQRRSTETLAAELMRVLSPLDPAESEIIRKRLDGDDLKAAQPFLRSGLRKMLITFGVGFHHSGMAPPARIAIEELVKSGLLRFCAATMGLSVGINFSVRSSLITDYKRPGEQGFVQYAPSETLQMLGRAGRRGRDAVGFSLWPSVPSFQKLGNAKRERCESRLRNDPTTFLGLLGRGYSLKQIETFYGKSFMRFRDRRVDLSVIRPEPIVEKLGQPLCCTSPAHEFGAYHSEERSLCSNCPLLEDCHAIIESKLSGTLSALHLHLHMIGCIDRNEKLTDFGNIARYFPQSGGLLIARMLADGSLNETNLLTGAQLMGAMALAHFKEPSYEKDYDFPFDAEELHEELEEYYPIELFEELYDPAQPRRPYPVLREFNPAAGYAVREWLSGVPWEVLSRKVVNERFAQGDLMGLLLRSATYLQSLRQARLGPVSEAASLLWTELMRPPLAEPGGSPEPEETEA